MSRPSERLPTRSSLAPLAVAIFALVGAEAVRLEARTATEVECEEAQLERLMLRFTTFGFGDNLFLWPTGALGYSGLATSQPFHQFAPLRFDRAEQQIAFDFLLHEQEGLLNPRRPALPQAVLVRKDVATSLVAEDVHSVSFELARQVIDPTDPQQEIFLTNWIGAPTGSASGAARSLAAEGFFESCSAEQPSDFDLRIFEILSRTVRVTDLLLPEGPGPGHDRYKTFFFRDVEPLTYRANLYSYFVGCLPNDVCRYGQARIAFRFRFALDADGRLATGHVQVLPACQAEFELGCTSAGNPNLTVVVAPPIWAGHERQSEPEFRSGAFLNIPYLESPAAILSANIPWSALLIGTAWDRRLGSP